MPDQWWQFYYAIQGIYDQNGLRESGCDYVPLPITREKETENQKEINENQSKNSDSSLLNGTEAMEMVPIVE